MLRSFYSQYPHSANCPVRAALSLVLGWRRRCPGGWFDSPYLLGHGRVARVGLADDRRQLQQRLGEDVLPYLAPEGWVPFQRINDVLEGGDRRGHFLVTSF